MELVLIDKHILNITNEYAYLNFNRTIVGFYVRIKYLAKTTKLIVVKDGED